MKFSENSDYGFAVGRVRAKEILLIRRNEYEKMVSIESEQELLSTVKGICRVESSEREPTSFENFLVDANLENQTFFSKYCIDRLVLELVLDATIIKSEQFPIRLKTLANEFLTTYFTTLINLENIRSFIRIKNLAAKEKQGPAEQRKIFSRVYLKNGTIPAPTFTDLFAEDWDAVIHCPNRVSDNLNSYFGNPNRAYHSCIEQGINYLVNKKSFLRLERLIEEEKQKVLIQAHYAIFGYEPLVAYYLFKENEIKNLRKIYYGLTEKTPTDQIQESVACILY